MMYSTMVSTTASDKRIHELGENSFGHHGKGAHYVTDTNLTMYGDVIMMDVEDVNDEQDEDEITDQTTNVVMQTSGPTAPQRCPRLTFPGASRNPGRPFVSPTDTLDPLDSFRFKELFPKLEVLQKLNNRYGERNESGAYIIDENITMHGDVLMLDLENIDGECDTDSGQRPSTAQKFTQLIEQIQTPREPPTKKRTTTGIRHLMAIRDKHQEEAFSSSSNVTDQTNARELIHSENQNHIEPSSINRTSSRKQTQTTKSSKTKSRGNVKHSGSKKARGQKIHQDSIPAKSVTGLIEMDISGHPSMQFVGDGKSTGTTKKKSLVERMRQQLNRFRAYIKRKVLKTET